MTRDKEYKYKYREIYIDTYMHVNVYIVSIFEKLRA